MSDEEQYPEDVEYAHKFIELLQHKLEEEYPQPQDTLRDFHSKLHGLVRARFTVEPNLPSELAVGVFSQQQSYQAWVRLSNGQPKVSPDKKGDVRGFAIKLMGVEGPKLLDDEKQTQDFLMVNAEVLGIRSVKEFYGIQTAMDRGLLSLVTEVLNPLHPHLRCMFHLAKAMHKCPNLLETDYWGVGAYSIGELPCKYKLRSHQRRDNHMPDKPADDFLRQRLVDDLGVGDATFDFMVQLRTDPDSMSIEDASVPWDEDKSPYLKVATLHIPSQSFDTPERRALSERMAFQPWHSLAAHKPLGGGQLARKIIYHAMSTFRRKRRGVEPYEPMPEPELEPEETSSPAPPR